MKKLFLIAIVSVHAYKKNKLDKYLYLSMYRKYFLYFILICLFSCKKQVEKERSEFIGKWYSPIHTVDFWYEIDIDSNSNGVFIEYTALGGGPSKKHGKAKANDKVLKIGWLKSIRISEYPHKIDTANSNIWISDWFINPPKKANWEMVGSGITFYKADY